MLQVMSGVVDQLLCLVSWFSLGCKEKRTRRNLSPRFYRYFAIAMILLQEKNHRKMIGKK